MFAAAWGMANASSEQRAPGTFQEELRTFLFLTVLMAPLVAVAVVGGYGFGVWMYQLIFHDLPGPG